MSGYRDLPTAPERQWTLRDVERHLRLAGEALPHQRVRVKRFHERTVQRAWLVLELCSGDDRFQRALQLVEGPEPVRPTLERPCDPPVEARHVTAAELPASLREQVEHAAAELRALGYRVEPIEVRHLEQTVLEVRYRVAGDRWTDVWLAADGPRVLGYAPWKRSASPDPAGKIAVSVGAITGVAIVVIALGTLLIPLLAP